MRILRSAETEKLRERVRELEGEVQALRARLAADGHPRIGTRGEFKRECAKFESLHVRHGIDFSLVVLELADATDPRRSLTQEAGYWATGVLLETMRAEDSCYEIDERFMALVLPATDDPGARKLLERLRFRLATNPCPGTPRRYVTVTGGVAQRLGNGGGIAALVRAAIDDIGIYQTELGRQRRAFSG